jgi:hypothetical protein
MKENKSLFIISQQFRALLENNYDRDDLSETEQKEIIESITNELKTKTDSVASYARKLKLDIENAKTEHDRIKKILEQRKAKAERFNDYILMCMDIMQESSIEGETSKLTIRKPSKVINIYDESKIPTQYLIEQTTVKVDKLSIKEMLKNGHEIKGARLEDGKRSVSVK